MWRRWSNKCSILQYQKMLQLQNNWPFSNLIQHLTTSYNIFQHVSIFTSLLVSSIAVHVYDFHIFTAIIQPYRVNKWLMDYFFHCTVYYVCLHWYLLLNHKEIVVLLPFQMFVPREAFVFLLFTVWWGRTWRIDIFLWKGIREGFLFHENKKILFW